MRKVLIANRGEIAVRVIRACRDTGLSSVAIYADSDRDAPHVRMADEAVALGGDRPADTYLDPAKVLRAARMSGADSLHPGYGFLSENADFAAAVEAEGLTWIGPPPAAIQALGDKVRARQIAREAGVPLAPGTPGPVATADEITGFAAEYGLPVAIKAALGGGGRGLRVVRTIAEIPEQYESAVREAAASFGCGDCFAERYIEAPRHVETQCLADRHGTVVVVSTRDCTLQRRHQKLIEEAPAPFLTGEQEAVLRAASAAILKKAGYLGAGTCEFLIGRDGVIAFLEVNTRLQVEHPVTEEVTGIDLVQEMFRIADGEPLGYHDPRPRGHAIEFRVTSEDPGRGFLPATGILEAFEPPAGPGVRLDSGVRCGTVVGPSWDSLLAKLIVTGATRGGALRRAARALAEFEISGVPTVLPFHRAVVTDPAFAPEVHGLAGPFTVHTRWVEDGFAVRLEPAAEAPGLPAPAAEPRQRVVVEVEGRRLELTVPADLFPPARPAPARTRPLSAADAPVLRPRGRKPGRASPAAGSEALTAAMNGVVVKVAVEEGQEVAAGSPVAVIEAMKMEQPVRAHRAGIVTQLQVEVGSVVTPDTAICVIR
jgi:acetyl-CoA/propionyl-CoA carboxylase biotin carboxyl carrier protein